MLKTLKNFITLFKPHIYIDTHDNILIRKLSIFYLGYVTLDRDTNYWWVNTSNQRRYASYKSLEHARARYEIYKKTPRKGTLITLP